jgi:hypothetical protein
VTLTDALAGPRQWYLNISWLLLGALSLMVSVTAIPRNGWGRWIA